MISLLEKNVALGKGEINSHPFSSWLDNIMNSALKYYLYYITVYKFTLLNLLENFFYFLWQP